MGNVFCLLYAPDLMLFSFRDCGRFQQNKIHKNRKKISLRSLKPWKHKDVYFDLCMLWSFLTADGESVAWSVGSLHHCDNISKHCVKDILHLLLQTNSLPFSVSQKGWPLSHRLTGLIHTTHNFSLWFIWIITFDIDRLQC